VVVPVMDTGETGRAEATVLHHADAAKVVRVVFALNEREDRARREAAWDAAGARVAALLSGVERQTSAGTGPQAAAATGTAAGREDVGRTVAFATIGDPNVYSTFTYLAQTLRALAPGLTVETVPGITAMQDLAARSGTVLAEGTEPLTLVPVTAGAELLKEALAGPGTVVAYKFGRFAAQVATALAESGRAHDAVWGAALGLPDERLHLAGTPLTRELPYLSTLIAPARREGRGGKL
jgi:precorrin-2/cobalt-factor-2 C20-methyltransferase